MSTKKNFLLSVVIPVYNEDHNIRILLNRLEPLIKEYDYEIIFVNDGSTDDTLKELEIHAQDNKNIKIISFYRNFGHQNALSCGYEYAKGDCVISLDADLQDPPEIIHEMIQKWQAGAAIVYAQRKKRDTDDPFKKATAHLFYKIINFLSDVPIPQEVGDFRLLDREVVEYLNKLPERSRFLRGLVAWGGFKAEYVEFEREKRHAGKTHYTLSKMVNFALDGITSFSTKPLRMATYFGFITSISSIVIILVKVIGHFVFNSSDWLPGWASLFFAIVFLGGVQLITIGIIGEYISKLFKEVQHRPNYIIKNTVNV